jgi:hypothetical protein
LLKDSQGNGIGNRDREDKQDKPDKGEFIIPCGKSPSVTQWNLGMRATAGFKVLN